MPDPASLHLWQNWGHRGSHKSLSPVEANPASISWPPADPGVRWSQRCPSPGWLVGANAPGWQQRAPGPPVFSPPGCSGQVWGKGEDSWVAVSIRRYRPQAGLSPPGGEVQVMTPGPSHPLHSLCSSALHPWSCPAPVCCPGDCQLGTLEASGDRVPPLFHGTAALGFDGTSKPRRPRCVPENSRSQPKATAPP